MTAERDRLAALLHEMQPSLKESTTRSLADRLIAAGVGFVGEARRRGVADSMEWVEDHAVVADLDVERLARALAKTKDWTPELAAELYAPGTDWLDVPEEWYETFRELAAAISAAYRENR